MAFGNTNKDIFSLTEQTFNYQSARLASLNYKFNPLLSMITFISILAMLKIRFRNGWMLLIDDM